MRHKIGLKLYASNVEYIELVGNYFHRGLLDYIELYVVPGDYKRYKNVWEKAKIPFVIHAAHCLHGVNLSKKSHLSVNRKAYSDARRYADLLNSPIIIFHPGLGGDVKETARQINLLGDKRIFIENKPFVALDGRRCVGGSVEDIKYIIKKCRVGFCLDVTHAIKYAFSIEMNYFEYIEKMMNLKPGLIHVCDGNSLFGLDEHLSMGDGNFEFVKIFDIINKFKKRYFITIESSKKLSAKLFDFKKDVVFLNKIIKEVDSHKKAYKII